ncbi:hypothetical protein B0I35DRAFT_196620 [Stachybotrys elegans]|uniref:Uncharacterized protein n=1 Tax=Stachybotrys elegans TaxID=80388 RepID=A0A8K0SFL6_9HYPO|nr:hypothetical protein B0I35DRAFT_196620 [Stachybotrys elegans]
MNSAVAIIMDLETLYKICVTILVIWNLFHPRAKGKKGSKIQLTAWFLVLKIAEEKYRFGFVLRFVRVTLDYDQKKETVSIIFKLFGLGTACSINTGLCA